MPPLHLGEGGRDNTLLLNHCDPAMTDTTYTQISPGEFAPNPQPDVVGRRGRGRRQKMRSLVGSTASLYSWGSEDGGSVKTTARPATDSSSGMGTQSAG